MKKLILWKQAARNSNLIVFGINACIMIHERQITCKQNQEEENKAAFEIVHGYFNEGRKGVLHY